MDFKFGIDKSGAPAVRFSNNRYIHILPVTKYQFERFVWETAPSWCDYKETFIEETGRVSPSEATRSNFAQAFITNVNFEEALNLCSWLNGRLPTIEEWNEAYEIAFTNDWLFGEAIEFMKSVEKEMKIDKRIMRLLERLERLGIKRTDLNSAIGELVCQFPVTPYGRIYIKYSNQRSAFVTGNPSKKTRDINFGFSGVVVCMKERRQQRN